jgi:hypothetical protein
MLHGRVRSTDSLVCCLGAMLLATGCAEKTFWVRHYPEFYTPELKVVAVAPFENDTTQPGAGGIFAAQLARALRIDGTYRVIGPGAVDRRMKDKGMPVTTQATNEELTADLRRLGGMQAFIHGTVTVFSSSQAHYREWDYYPYEYPYYPYGFGYYGWGRWYEDWETDCHEWGGVSYAAPVRQHVNCGNVAVRAEMIRISDGAVLYSTPAPVSATVDLRLYMAHSPRDALMEAVHRVVGQLVCRFAIVPTKVSVNADKDLVTATGQTEGRWDLSETFRSSDEKMYVVVRLPKAAARNAFVLTITPKGRINNVAATKDIVWLPKYRTEGFVFSPKEIAAEAGPGAFTANFYADGRLVMSHDFQIK